MTSEEYQHIMSLTQPYISGLGEPVKKPVRKTWQAVFNADWKLLHGAYLKHGEICPTWFLHWDDCMRKLRTPMTSDEAKAPAVTMASLAIIAYRPLAVAFAHEGWVSPRPQGESDEDYRRRLAEVPPSEQTNRVETVGLVMLIRDGDQVQQGGRGGVRRCRPQRPSGIMRDGLDRPNHCRSPAERIHRRATQASTGHHRLLLEYPPRSGEPRVVISVIGNP